MGAFGPMHWLILIVVVMLLLGGGKLSSMMGDAAKGVKAFKEGLKDEPDAKDVKSEAALPKESKDS